MNFEPNQFVVSTSRRSYDSLRPRTRIGLGEILRVKSVRYEEREMQHYWETRDSNEGGTYTVTSRYVCVWFYEKECEYCFDLSYPIGFRIATEAESEAYNPRDAYWRNVWDAWLDVWNMDVIGKLLR